MLCYVVGFLMWPNVIPDMREPQIFPCDVFGLCNLGGGAGGGLCEHCFCNSCKYYYDSLIAVVWYVFSLLLAYFEAKDAGLS